MKASNLLKMIEFIEFGGNANLYFKGISFDTRTLKKGDLFFALKGSSQDGHNFIKEALSKGATGIVFENKDIKKILYEFKDSDFFWIRVRNSKAALSWTSKYFYKIDKFKCKLIGITGTNGKTTTSILVHKILSSKFKKGVLIGTLGHRVGDVFYRDCFTTPPSPYLFKLLKEGISKFKAGYVVMEASSQGLEERKLDSLRFDVAIFTNLSRDHLDYHHCYKNYFQAKKRLFKLVKNEGVCIINIDDKYGRRLWRYVRGDKLSYSLKDRKAYVWCKDFTLKSGKQIISISTPKGSISIKTSLWGRHNVYNIMASICCGLYFGICLDSIKNSIESIKEIPGRLQRIRHKDIYGFVDYAHTPSALKIVLQTLRSAGFKKIITVFGCGGNRDKDKRPQMGRIATEFSDKVIITNDNPRWEDPQEIIKDILKGIKNSRNVIIELDRREAIKKAVEISAKGEAILIAGKGHEKYQIIKDAKIKFDDFEYLKEYLYKK